MITLSDTLTLLETLAPPDLAAEWDNIGLLLESKTKSIRRILLTLDLTPAVAAEAIKKKSNLVISYHPPLFSGITRLTHQEPLTGALLDLHRAGISVYSPHTALDAAPEGIADWLCTPFEARSCEPIEGSGRLLNLRRAMTPNDLAEALTSHLNLPYIRRADPAGRSKKIRTLALCPGSGASLLKTCTADAVFTGEMKHHDALFFQRHGCYVYLSEHGHTERPYLKHFRQRLLTQLPDGVRVEISRRDKEPLSLWQPDA